MLFRFKFQVQISDSDFRFRCSIQTSVQISDSDFETHFSSWCWKVVYSSPQKFHSNLISDSNFRFRFQIPDSDSDFRSDVRFRLQCRFQIHILKYTFSSWCWKVVRFSPQKFDFRFKFHIQISVVSSSSSCNSRE